MNKTSDKNISIVFSEVYEIISHFSKDMLDKIPKEFLELIKSNRSKKSSYRYDTSKPLNNQNISEEAKDLISYIYIAYISENSEELIKICKENDMKKN